MQEKQFSEFTQRDDIIIFSDAVASTNNNHKSLQLYRKFHEKLYKKSETIIPRSTECTYQNGYVRTIDVSQKTIDHASNQKMKLNLDSLPVRRNSMTAGSSRRKQQGIKTQSRTLHLRNQIIKRQNDLTTKVRDPKTNKYSFIEKMYNKGPIKDKYLANWLNAILMQACSQQKFDITTDNPALKKFNLDQNSLKSKGIKPDHLNRIYKSLFVYSIGFNNLLRDICEKNMNLRKTIWKVFAILLQYCAEGNFQTMIAEIQRDKIEKVEALTKQIRDRQKIIEDNAQINEKKNAKIFKQIKQLRQQNQNLANQKLILIQQFKQAEQAFNQEVTLRLRFQNKINEIHGVYMQIQGKHERLLHNYNDNKTQLEKLKALTQQQNKMIVDLRMDNQNKHSQLKELKKQLKYKDEYVIEMQIRKNGDASQYIENVNNIKDLKLIIQEKKRQIKQLNLSLNNSKLLFETQKNQHSQTSLSLQASLQQNSKLHNTIQSQMKDLNQLFNQKKNFGITTSQIQAETVLAKEKLQQKIQQIKKLQTNLIQVSEQKRKALVQAQAQIKLRQKIQSDLSLCYENIKQMKNAKNIIQQQLLEKRRKVEIIDEIINEKQVIIKAQLQQIEKLTVNLAENNQAMRNMESKIEILSQKIKSSQDIYGKKIAALKQQKQAIQKAYSEYNTVKQTLQIERDKLKSKLEQCQISLKNQKFQRINLNIFYKNSLNTGQEKSEEIKKLDMKLSELNEQLSNYKRQLKNIQYIHEQKDKQTQKQIKSWTQRYKMLVNDNKQRRQYIHPMLYQQIAERFRNATSKLAVVQNQNKQQVLKMQKQCKQQETELKQKHNELQNQIKRITKTYEAALNKKQNQLLYEASKTGRLQQQNNELQQKILKYEHGGKQSFDSREQKYITQLLHNKQKIDELIKQLNNVCNANNDMKQNYINFENTLAEKQKKIQQLQQKLSQTKITFEQILSKKEEQIKAINKIMQQQINRDQSQNYLTQKRKQKLQQKKVHRRQSQINDSLKKNDDNQRQLNLDDSKRGDFARKYKGAFVYYNK